MLIIQRFSAKSHQQASQTAINAKRELWTMRQNVLPLLSISLAINHLTNSPYKLPIEYIQIVKKPSKVQIYQAHIFRADYLYLLFYLQNFHYTVTMCCLAKAWQFLVTCLVNHKTQFTIFYVAVWKQSVFLEEKMLHQFRSNCIGLFL